MSDIVARLRDPMIAFDYGDRLIAGEEFKRLRAALLRIANMASPALPILEMPASVARAVLEEKGTELSDPMRDSLEQRERTLEARIAELEREIERLRSEVAKAVAGERAAILDLIESYQQDGHLYDADYVLRAVAAAIKARGRDRWR
jgi:hypothetical protein